MNETQKKMVDIFRASFSLEMNDAEIQTLTRLDCNTWDSMGHLNLMLAVEDVFQVAIPEEKWASINSYWNMVQLLEGSRNGS